MRHPLQKPSCNSAHICSWCARTNQWAGYGNLRFHTYGSRCLCRLHSTEGGACAHTHTVQRLHPEPYPLDTFNYPAKTVNASFATTSKVFFYWSLCVIMTYTWTGSKPSGRCLIPGWKAVLNETGLPWPPQSTRKGRLPGRSPAQAKANAPPHALRLRIVPGSPPVAQTTSLLAWAESRSRTNEISTGACPVTQNESSFHHPGMQLSGCRPGTSHSRHAPRWGPPPHPRVPEVAHLG